MGVETFYCFKCRIRLSGADLEAGRAIRSDNRIACRSCAPELKAGLPAGEPGPPPERSEGQRDPVSTRRAGSPKPSRSTGRIPMVREPGRPPGRSRLPYILGGVALAVVLGGILLVWKGSGDSGENRVLKTETSRRDPSRGPTEGAPGGEASEALKRARARSQGGDLELALAAFEEAVQATRGTPEEKEALEGREALLRARKAAWSRELAGLEEQARPRIAREEFSQARDVFESVRARRTVPEWSALLDEKIQELRKSADALYASLLGQAGVNPNSLRDRVARWGYPHLVADLEKRLAALAVSRASASEDSAFRAAWKQAMARATLRDYDGAALLLTSAAGALREGEARAQATSDLEDLRLVKELVARALGGVARSPRGGMITLAFRDSSGSPKEASGKVGRANPRRIELLQENGPPVFVELEELTAASLGSLGGPRPAAEARGLALVCLLEGDPEGARRLLPDQAPPIPPRYWEYVQETAAQRPRAPAREWEARALFYAADGEYSVPAKTGLALEKYRRLLDEYPDTRLVQSDRDLLARRSEGGKEYLFLAPLLRGAGTFQIAAQEKLEAAWTSTADSEKANLNFVEAEFYARPDTAYRAWVLAGGCCAETFDFYWQATELTDLHPRSRQKISVEPEGGFASPVRHSIVGLKKSHALHARKEPKAPARWEWIPLSLPKYSAAGPKKIRFLTDQQGFSVGALFVTSLRLAPPAEAELREEVASVHPGQSLGPPPDLRPWRAVFDGKSLDCLRPECASAWRVEGQAIALVPGQDNAAQTREEFGDGELRLRFEVKEGTTRIMFNMRQAGGGLFGWTANESELRPLVGRPHELSYKGQGAAVTATLDGRPLPLSQVGAPLRGPLQFNAHGDGFRILAIEVREAR